MWGFLKRPHRPPPGSAPLGVQIRISTSSGEDWHSPASAAPPVPCTGRLHVSTAARSQAAADCGDLGMKLVLTHTRHVSTRKAVLLRVHTPGGGAKRHSPRHKHPHTPNGNSANGGAYTNTPRACYPHIPYPLSGRGPGVPLGARIPIRAACAPLFWCRTCQLVFIDLQKQPAFAPLGFACPRAYLVLSKPRRSPLHTTAADEPAARRRRRRLGQLHALGVAGVCMPRARVAQAPIGGEVREGCT